MDRRKCEALVKALMEVGVVEDGDLQWLAAEDILLVATSSGTQAVKCSTPEVVP